MSDYETIKFRIAFEEAKLEGLTNQVSLTKATIKGLKSELTKADPAAVKKNKKNSDGLPLAEVRDEGEFESLYFTDGHTSKIERVRKPGKAEKNAK